jgi:DNA polymerase-4
MKARCVSVSIRDIDFNDKSHQKRLSASSDITTEIFSVCQSLINELWDTKKPLRLLGVTLSDVTDEDDIQLSIFDSDKKDKERAIDKTVDSIRNKFGKDTIVRGGIYKKNIRVGKDTKK